MALSVSFTVHSVHVVPSSVTVQFNGQDVAAVVDGCEVVFIDANGASYTRLWTGAECQEARDKFKAGDQVTWAL